MMNSLEGLGGRWRATCSLGLTVIAIVALSVACKGGKSSEAKPAASVAPPARPVKADEPAAPKAQLGGPSVVPSGSTVPSEGVARTAEPPPSAPQADKSPAPLKDPEIRLLDAGKAPHRALRFRPSVGTTETLSTTTRLGIEMQGLGAPGSMQRMPTTRIESKTRIVEAKAEGDIRYDFEIAGVELVGDSTLPAEVLSGMKSSFEPLRGLTGRGVATQRGLVREVKLDTPPGSDRELAQILGAVERALRQMASPFPEEAVGIGARWKHATTIEEQGVTLTQTATYTLVSLDGDQGNVTFTLEQAAPKQSLKGAGVPEGMGILSLTGKGSGETSFDLKRLTPKRASLELTSQGDVSVNGQVVTTKTQTSMLIEGK